MTTGKALLIVGGVAVGAYVLLSLIKGGTPSGPVRPPMNTDYGFVSSLLNFGAAAAQAFGSTPRPASAYQNSAGAEAYAYEADGVLPKNATATDYQTNQVVYGPFLPS